MSRFIDGIIGSTKEQSEIIKILTSYCLKSEHKGCTGEFWSKVVANIPQYDSS